MSNTAINPTPSALQRFFNSLKNLLSAAHTAGKSAPPHRPLNKSHRHLRTYLRALWGRDFVLRTGEANEPPYLQNGSIYLPETWQDMHDVTSPETVARYRAAAAHAAAHFLYSDAVFTSASYDDWQRAVLAVIEDARVETLAMREFPGLRKIWAAQHHVTPDQQHTANDYLARLARALLDKYYRDDDVWIAATRQRFAAADNIAEPTFALEFGVQCAREFPHRKLSHRGREALAIAYRDDHRHLWKSVRASDAEDEELPSYLLRTNSALLASDETNPDGKRDPDHLRKEKFHAENADTSAPFLYDEWDYQHQVETPAWTTLREVRPKSGDVKIVAAIFAQHSHLLTRMKIALNALRFGNMQRLRQLEEGDEVDINAAIRAQIELHHGISPDPRIMMRSVRKDRDISIMLLLDLSHSMNQPVKGQTHSALDLTRQACVLLADAIASVGDPFAIHGFCSDSRHHVEYFRIKDFAHDYDELAQARIAGMTAQRGTRMGAAIRHATHCFNEQKSGKKLLMMLTDGEPADVDVRGRNYLLHDARRAVEEAARCGIQCYCIALDPAADEYAPRIFGRHNYTVIDHIKRLPEKMLLLYAKLAK